MIFVLALGGCASSAGADGGDDTCAVGCNDDGATSAVGSTGGGASSGVSSVDDGGSGTPPGDADLPCEVVDVIERNCIGCHSDPMKFGAPMSLVSHTDFAIPAASDPARKVYEVAADRIVDPVKPMPPIEPMSDADRQVLAAWFDAGAPADPAAECAPVDPTGDGPVGPDELPCEPDRVFVASAGDGSSDGFHVPASGADNLYMCFTFASPFATPTQGTAWAPITDDERVLHHWILFRSKTPQPDGGAGPCNMPGDAVFVSGWAPGGQNFVMPDDVGLELGGPDDYYILQVHYHNTGHYSDAIDKSGVALCTTETPRPQTAGVLTLGTTQISIPADGQDVTATGLCPAALTSLLPTSLNALASFPHMHQLGRKFDTIITRDGSDFPLVEVDAFSFDNQISYIHDPPVVIEAGDTLTTHCTYDNTYGVPVGFGEKTEDEMCFNFLMVYPVDVIPDDYRVCMTG